MVVLCHDTHSSVRRAHVSRGAIHALLAGHGSDHRNDRFAVIHRKLRQEFHADSIVSARICRIQNSERGLLSVILQH